jgi:hypothetical protein
MTKDNTKPKLLIFKNEKAGQPIVKRDGSYVEYNGQKMLEPDLNGKITLPAGLDAGEYQIAIYRATSKKGSSYYSGTIKPAFDKNKTVNSHNKAKSNGYQPQEEVIGNEFDSESIPF